MISNIRGERARMDLSQDQLASKLETSGSSVREWESGRSMPSPEMLLRMSDLFGCTTDYLLGRTQERVGIRVVSAHQSGRDVYTT